MDLEMDASPSYFDPENLSSREPYRRYRRRQSTSSILPLPGNSVSKFSEARLFHDGSSIQRRPNAALLLEEIKLEVESFDVEGTTQATFNSSKRQASIDSRSISELNTGLDSIRRDTSQSLKSIKHEDEVFVDGGETIFTLFAILLD